MSDAIDVSDKTKFAMPIRNLISLIASVAVGVWAYFGIIERLNRIETNNILMQADLIKNTEFRLSGQGRPRQSPCGCRTVHVDRAPHRGSLTNYSQTLKQVKHHSISNKHSH
jgi:hypothetical protein